MRLSAAILAVLLALPGPAGADEAPPGAMACSGCHGTGSSLSLDGLSAAEIAEAMAAFKSGARDATVMKRIAAGFDDAEIAAIAAWIAGRN